MADPVGVQLRKAGVNAVRPGELPAVRDRDKARPRRDAERGGERSRWPATFIVAEAKPHDTIPRVLGGEPRKRPGVEWMLCPVRGEYARADLARVAGRVEL